MIEQKYCLNCGYELRGKFCSECGQKRFNPSERTVKFLINHFFEELFNWDSKVLKSMLYLFIRPGYLTQEYISGRIQSYVSPLKMYVFTSVILFFVMIKMSPDQYNGMVNPDDSEDFISNIILEAESQSGMDKQNYIDKFNSEVNDKVTIYIFLIMVIFSLLLKIIYITKQIYFAEHVVFTLHFFTLVLWCFLLASLFDNTDFVLFSVFVIPSVYLFFAIKRVYHKRWSTAIFSCFFLSLSYIFLIALWIIGTIVISAWVV